MDLTDRYQTANERSAERRGLTTVSKVEWFLWGEDYGTPMWTEMDASGSVPIPQDSGVGFELDWEFVEASRVDSGQLNRD